MALKAVLDSVDGLDDEVKSFFMNHFISSGDKAVVGAFGGTFLFDNTIIDHLF